MNLPVRCVLAALILCVALPASSDARHFGRRKFKPRATFQPTYNVISAINPVAQTVTISHVNSTDKSTPTLRVERSTEIQVNGNRGTFADVKTGMRVSITPGASDSTAGRLVLSPAPTVAKTTPARARRHS